MIVEVVLDGANPYRQYTQHVDWPPFLSLPNAGDSLVLGKEVLLVHHRELSPAAPVGPYATVYVGPPVEGHPSIAWHERGGPDGEG